MKAKMTMDGMKPAPLEIPQPLEILGLESLDVRQNAPPGAGRGQAKPANKAGAQEAKELGVSGPPIKIQKEDNTNSLNP